MGSSMYSAIASQPVRVMRVLSMVTLFHTISCGGGGGSSPTTPGGSSPTTPSGTLAAPAFLTAGTVSLRERTVPLTWGAVSNASAFVIEVSASAEFSNPTTINTPDASTSFTLTNAPLGHSFARVRAKNDAGTSNPSIPIAFTVVDFQNFIEALFLGTGPLEAPNDPLPCVNIAPGVTRGVLHGFARGANVPVRVASALSGSVQNLLREQVATIPVATVGRLNTTFELSADPDPPQRDSEIVLAFSPDTVRLCGNALACGQIPFLSLGLMRSAKFTYSPTIGDVPAVHEVAHLLGMCHVSAELIGGRPTNSLMGRFAVLPTSGPPSHDPRLTPWDIEALKAVYGSSLQPGAVRSDFVAAGLATP